jgi:hypothetical protein
MDPLNMAPEVVQMLESEISALGMLTPDPLAALLSLLAPDEMLVIEVVVHDIRSAVCKGALFTRESLITNTIRTLRTGLPSIFGA